MTPGDSPVAVITGGAGSLGAALHAEFTDAGWIVHALSRARMDVRDPVQVDRVIGGLERIDLMVCCAGLRRDALFRNLTEMDWDLVMETNLQGVWRCMRAGIPVMLRQGHGHIVTIGSGSGRHGAIGQTAYASSKAGLIALTQSAAAEWGPANIRVNAVLPGWMPTAFNADLPESRHMEARRRLHLGRFNSPPQTASFIRFLHGMVHTSGQVFQLDSRTGSS